MFYYFLRYGLILSQAQVPNPGQAASTITEDGVAASEAVAKSIDKLWNDVLSGGLYSAIANLGIFFAVGTLLIFIVQWTKEMIDGDSSRGFTEIIWPIVVIVLLANHAQPLAAVTQGLRGIINQTNQTLLASTSASIQLQEAYQQVMLKTGKGDAIQSLIAQCNAIADPTQQTQCLQNASKQAKEIESQLDNDNRPDWLKGISDFFNTNIFQLTVRGWLLALAIAFQWIVEVCLLLTALLGPLAVGGSLLPVGNKAIFAWLTGFFSVGMIKLCFNIISGLVATIVLNANNNDPMIFAFAIGILAPILSVVLAAGGGMAIFRSFSSLASFGLSSVVMRIVNKS
ncbi:hypothetical protein NIES37_39750 [Tolypothrix tenuis PCC 7101]|uniref:Uncharacterized protein n=1 Tax=Tolypothrix tenuis PCC 7101 TaxID=231146 RepID=A0A1Z4N2M6_9CYAN|nr:hypothetical protein [Aulosira sp. FACHB-113]BAY99992.1 hypothetical protein NIES37_39750 [Tolypothrix tenuis PCC 7101]BAZ76086.1 hypothetical protein NIES50_46840 [Aulosira laxa NIES-50]